LIAPSAPDGTWGVTTGAEGAIKLWDIDAVTGRWSEKEVLSGARGVVGTSMIDPSGTRMYTLSSDRMLLVWDVSPTGGFGAPRSGLRDRWITDEPAVVEPGKLVVVPTRPYGSAVPGNMPYHGNGTAEVAATFLDPRTGRVVDEVPIGKTLEPLWSGASVAASPGGSLIAVSSGHAVTVLDATTRAAAATLPVPAAGARSASGSLPEGVVGPVAWSADGSRLFVGVQAVDVVDSLINPFAAERGGTLVAVDRRTWQVTDTRRVAVVPEAVQVSPDGATVAVAGGNGDTVLILDASTLDPRSTVHLRQEDQPAELTFSRDGRLLLVGGSGVLHVIDTASGRAREPASADVNGGIQQIEWLPDGRTVVVSGSGGLISFFDVVRGLVRTAPLPASPDGGQGTYFMVPRPTDEIAVLGDRERVMSYPVTTSAWLQTACDIAGRDLTRAEWDRYLPGREYRATCSDLG